MGKKKMFSFFAMKYLRIKKQVIIYPVVILGKLPLGRSPNERLQHGKLCLSQETLHIKTHKLAPRLIDRYY